MKVYQALYKQITGDSYVCALLQTLMGSKDQKYTTNRQAKSSPLNLVKPQMSVNENE